MAKYHKVLVMHSRDTGPLDNYLRPFGPIVMCFWYAIFMYNLDENSLDTDVRWLRKQWNRKPVPLEMRDHPIKRPSCVPVVSNARELVIKCYPTGSIMSNWFNHINFGKVPARQYRLTPLQNEVLGCAHGDMWSSGHWKQYSRSSKTQTANRFLYKQG